MSHYLRAMFSPFFLSCTTHKALDGRFHVGLKMCFTLSHKMVREVSLVLCCTSRSVLMTHLLLLHGLLYYFRACVCFWKGILSHCVINFIRVVFCLHLKLKSVLFYNFPACHKTSLVFSSCLLLYQSRISWHHKMNITNVQFFMI